MKELFQGTRIPEGYDHKVYQVLKTIEDMEQRQKVRKYKKK